MNTRDIIRYSFFSIERARSRTALMLLAVAIAVTSVILLIGLGEAARRYVTQEFASLGTNLIFVLPGKSETTGGTLGASLGSTTRPITIQDAQALTRHPSVSRVAPMVIGAANINRAGLERESVVQGTTAEMLQLREWQMYKGSFLPAGNWQRASPVCVIGRTIEAELFGPQPSVGQFIRIGESRFRVIGVLDHAASTFGMTVDDSIMVPIASAMRLFNTDSIFRIMIESDNPDSIPAISKFVTNTLKTRHHGEDDATVITQDAVHETFNTIFNALTLTVAGIAAISLAVAGVLIMNVMLVTVSQRTGEVGLLKALGASPSQIVWLFLTESAMLSLFGALIGVVVGVTACWLVSAYYPILDMLPPVWAVAAGVLVAFLTGLAFGILPARRAASLDPIASLAKH